MIAVKTNDENSQDNSDSTHVQSSIDAYEVRKSVPRHGDSYIGGLDILTVHQMIEEQNRDNRTKGDKSA